MELNHICTLITSFELEEALKLMKNGTSPRGIILIKNYSRTY
jgi:hypothetical protein